MKTKRNKKEQNKPKKQTNNKVKFSLIAKKTKSKKPNNDPKNKPATNEVIKSTYKLKTTHMK